MTATMDQTEEKSREFLQLLLKQTEEQKLLKFLNALRDDSTASSGFELHAARLANNKKDLEISGVAAGYGNADRQDEIFDPGAFKESLARHKSEGTRPLMLLNHHMASVIGRWDDFRENNSGLLCKGTILAGIRRGADAIAMIEGNAASSLSVGFNGSVKQSVGRVTHITKANLIEVSIVFLPANARAKIHGQ